MPILGELFPLGFPALCFCGSSFQPEVPNAPPRISDRDGVLAAIVPVAAHIPGGGFASNSLILAVRKRLGPDVADALVEVRERCWGGVVELVGLLLSGRGNGTGVRTLALDDAMV